MVHIGKYAWQTLDDISVQKLTLTQGRDINIKIVPIKKSDIYTEIM